MNVIQQQLIALNQHCRADLILQLEKLISTGERDLNDLIMRDTTEETRAHLLDDIADLDQLIGKLERGAI